MANILSGGDQLFKQLLRLDMDEKLRHAQKLQANYSSMRYLLFYLQILPVFTESAPHNHHHTPHHHITPQQMRGIICNRM